MKIAQQRRYETFRTVLGNYHQCRKEKELQIITNIFLSWL